MLSIKIAEIVFIYEYARKERVSLTVEPLIIDLYRHKLK